MKKQMYSQEPEDALRHSASLSKLHTVMRKLQNARDHAEPWGHLWSQQGWGLLWYWHFTVKIISIIISF